MELTTYQALVVTARVDGNAATLNFKPPNHPGVMVQISRAALERLHRQISDELAQ